MTTNIRLTRIAILVTITLAPGAFAHPHPDGDAGHQHMQVAAVAHAQEAARPATSGRIVSGSGDFRYEYAPEKLQLPAEVRMKHGHGLCHDAAGNIYFVFEPEKVEADTKSLVRFNPDGTGAVLLGKDNALSVGAPHGLNIHTEKDGKTYLDHANNAARVHKTTLSGDIIWSQVWGPQMGNYKPTDVVVPPGSDKAFVADGYGSSMIHALKTSDGIYAGKSWGGRGKEHSEFNCPHGITYDPRRKLLLVSDRGNKRLEYFTLNGLYHSTVEAPEIKAPCNADVWGDFVLVPNLDGPLVILDKENKPVSVIEVGKLLGANGHKHPHDAIWLANGDIVCCTWNPGRIS
ncbi:MAG: hypothetical protein HZA91_15700, partial [Verrucomicrobia bacterium]|nr:hypothetical protein [Verrucomicrobiota bacterium]